MLVIGHQAPQRAVAGNGRMEVDFAFPLGQFCEQPAHAFLCHVTAPGDAEAMVAGCHPRRAHLPAEHARPAIQSMGAEADACAAARENRRRFGRNAHARETELATDVEHQPADRRMQVHVLVCVRVGEGQAGGSEGGELGAYLGSELTVDARTNGVVDAETELARREPALGVHEVGDLFRRQHSGALDDHKMQPDAQVRHGAYAPYGIGGGGGGHHQAGGVQDAHTVRALNRLVDRLGEAEIIGGKEDALHVGDAANGAAMAGR